MKNKIDFFNYLEKSIIDNSKLIFKEKKKTHNLDKIFNIIENFMISNKLICYGGTALNNILPKESQFYDYDSNLPDYDFFSPTALEHVKELAIIFKKAKYKNILAKSALHPGTYKLYVNYIQIADITHINEDLYKKLLNNTIIRNSIHYAPLNFLRMNLFLELSRPRGDISRWEKIMNRLIIFNKSYPFTIINCENKLTFEHHKNKDKKIFLLIDNILKKHDLNNVIFIGEYAIKEYTKYFPNQFKNMLKKNKLHTFILLSNDAKKVTNEIYEKINKSIHKENKITIKEIKNIDDFLPKYYNIYINNIHYLSIFKTDGCQNYNTITRNKKEIKIGTLDTMLYYYFMFFYLDFDTILKNHLYCYCFILFYIQENYNITNNKILQRFNLSCIGNQTTLEDIIDFKNKKYQKLKNNRSSLEYKKYFLKYIPRKKTKKMKKTKKNNKTKKQTVKKKNE